MKQKIITIKEALKGKVEIKKFKKLIKKMYNGFPTFIFHGEVEEVIKTDETIQHLIDNKILVERNFFGNREYKICYSLGVGALPLISAWETEELTNQIKWLTVSIIIMTIVLIILEF